MRKRPRRYRPGQVIVIHGHFARVEESMSVMEVFDAGLYTATAATEAVYRMLSKRFDLTMQQAREQFPNLQCNILQPHQ